MNQYVFDNFSKKFLEFKPLTKFLLISLCGNLSFHMSAYPILGFISDSIGFTGAVSLVLWLHGIAYKSVELLQTQGVESNIAKYLEAFMFIYLIARVYIIIGEVSQDTISFDMGIIINISYVEPALVSVFWLVSYLLMSAYTAKLFEFSVLDEEPEIDSYYKTFLLVLFPVVGIWLMEEKLKSQKKMLDAISTNQDQIEIPQAKEEDSQTDRKKYTYNCKEGILIIEQKHDTPSPDDKAFLNGNPAPTQKYEIGDNQFVYVSNGVVYSERM